MKVYFVGAGPGDPELLTLKGRRLLEQCGCCIYAGSLVNPDLLEFLQESAERHDSAGLSLEEMKDLFARAKSNNWDVVRLHTGDPSIFGATGEQMRLLEELGIPFEVVPGVSSFASAAAALKTPLTSPEECQTIILTRVSGRTEVPTEQSLDELARTGATLCLFLSVDRLEEIAERLIPHYGSDCPAAVVYHASWPDEQRIQCALSDLPVRVKEAGIRKTGLVLVGRALGRSFSRSKLYDEGFSHEYRKAKSP